MIGDIGVLRGIVSRRIEFGILGMDVGEVDI